MIYTFLANGLEEVEALAPIDVMRRAGLEVKTVSITGESMVMGAHGVGILADSLFGDDDYSDADMLFLPGGMPGSVNLSEHKGLCDLILAHNAQGKPLAAICAAPFIFGDLGIVEGKRMTCYPGFESHLVGAEYTAALTETDGVMFTGCGPAAALQLGYNIVEYFCGKEKSEALMEGMRYTLLSEE